MIKKLWLQSAPLTATAVLMLIVFLACVVGIFVDPRLITGMPAWLKPAKFAISTAIYSATMAWLFQYIQVWPRFIRAATSGRRGEIGSTDPDGAVVAGVCQ